MFGHIRAGLAMLIQFRPR